MLSLRRLAAWLKRVIRDDEILLCVCDKEGNHSIQGEGKVTELALLIFRDIPARILEKEHAIEARQYSGLLKGMRFAYGEDFSENELVTVLGYLRLK